MSCIVSYGILTNGQVNLFVGLADVKFEHFIGLKFDPETDCYTFGRFNKDFQLDSFGVRTDGIDEYHANFKNGVIQGLAIWHEYRMRRSIGYWKNGFRHGLHFYFANHDHNS